MEDLQKRKIELELTGADCLELTVIAGKANMTASELLQAFICDLIGNDRSSGSDEREFASGWYDRCGFAAWTENSFVRYLIETTLIDDFLQRSEIIQDREADIKGGPGAEELAAAQEEISFQKEMLQEIYADYAANTADQEPRDAAFEKALKFGRIYSAAKQGVLT